MVRTTRRWDVYSLVAALEAGEVVVWFQGDSEFGPRILGHRSLLGDPRDEGRKDRINDKVKFREPYRPFAPCVPAEVADDWFEGGVTGSTAMPFVARVRPDRRDRLGAVTHADGTARVQVVHAADNRNCTACYGRSGDGTR